MNCIVCVACVPDTASVIKIGPDGKNIDEAGIKWIVSPYDEYALERLLQRDSIKGIDDVGDSAVIDPPL